MARPDAKASGWIRGAGAYRRGGDPGEREVPAGGVAGCGGVTLLVDGIVVPGPRDDRFLLITGEQVAPALAVAGIRDRKARGERLR